MSKRIKTDVLDHGYVEIVDYMGDDARVVNAARVSFGKEIDHVRGDDLRLIEYLAKHMHQSPFRHVQVTLRMKAPEFVMRQWYKHVVGAETTSSYATKDHAWNEISQRYVEVDEYHIPVQFRTQSSDVKQGSDGVLSDINQADAHKEWKRSIAHSMRKYQSLLDLGVAKEQARGVFPLAVYTQVMWTASLQAVVNFMMLRDALLAQAEIRAFAHAMDDMLRETEFSRSYDALLKYTRKYSPNESTR